MERTYRSCFFSHEVDGIREGTAPYQTMRTVLLERQSKITMTLRVRERLNDPVMDFIYLQGLIGSNQNLRLSTITNPSKDNDGNDIQSYTLTTNVVDSNFRAWFPTGVSSGDWFIDIRPLLDAETDAGRNVYGIQFETEFQSNLQAFDLNLSRGYKLIFELDRAFNIGANPWRPHHSQVTKRKIGGGWAKTNIAQGRADGRKARYAGVFPKLLGVDANRFYDLQERNNFYFSMFGSQGAVLTGTYEHSFPVPRVTIGSSPADIYQMAIYGNIRVDWSDGLPEDENQDVRINLRES